MRKVLFILMAIVTLFSCKSTNNKNTDNNTSISTIQKDCIEILYFHGKKRCITCNAIENLTKEVIETSFAKQLKSGEITFNIIDISQSNNKEIADKYEVTWSSLFINKRKNGKETINNMTEYGFANAKNAPDKFKTAIKQKVEELLK